MPKCLIFDVDGVLLDSPHESAWGETLRELVEEVGASPDYDPEAYTTEVYQTVVAGKPRYSGAADLLAHFGIADPGGELSRRLGDLKQAKIEALIQQGRFQPFADAVLLALRAEARGWMLAVASSSKNARAMLVRSKLPDGRTLAELFCADVCGIDLPQGKPHPAIFLEAAALAGVEPASCAVVEDAPNGVEAAKAAGMAAIGVARLKDEHLLKSAGANIVLDNLDNLDLDALTKLLGR